MVYLPCSWFISHVHGLSPPVHGLSSPVHGLPAPCSWCISPVRGVSPLLMVYLPCSWFISSVHGLSSPVHGLSPPVHCLSPMFMVYLPCPWFIPLFMVYLPCSWFISHVHGLFPCSWFISPCSWFISPCSWFISPVVPGMAVRRQRTCCGSWMPCSRSSVTSTGRRRCSPSTSTTASNSWQLTWSRQPQKGGHAYGRVEGLGWLFLVLKNRPEKSFTPDWDWSHDSLLASQVIFQFSYPGWLFCFRFILYITGKH